MAEHKSTSPLPERELTYHGKPCRVLKHTPGAYALIDLIDGGRKVVHASEINPLKSTVEVLP